MNGEDPKISNLKTAASTNNPKILYNALSNLPRSDRYRCLYTLDGQGMNLLEWAIHNDYWNSAHLLVYYAWVGNNFQLRNYSDLDPCRVPSLYWNQIFAHTISLFHSTKQIRDPKITNDELPVELRQRLSVYKKVQEQGCFDLESSIEDELVFMLLIRLGEDVTRKNSQSTPLLSQMVNKRSIACLKFIAALHPLIGYTERAENNSCVLIYCLECDKYPIRVEEFNALKTKEAFEKLLEDSRLLAPYITLKRFERCFTEDERTRVLASLSEEEFDATLSIALKDDFMSTSLMKALLSVLKRDNSPKKFSTTLALEFKLIGSFIAAYFIQNRVGEGSIPLQSMEQQWKGKLSKTRFSERTEFPIDQLPTEMLLLVAQYLRADDILSLLLTTKSLSKILSGGSALWQQHFLSEKMQFKPDSRCMEWKSVLASQARTCVKWRAGRLVAKREIDVGRIHLMHQHWALITDSDILKAWHWEDEASSLFCGQFAPFTQGRWLVHSPFVIESTYDTLKALAVTTVGYGNPYRAEIGVLARPGTEVAPVQSIDLPPEYKGTISYDFLRDKTHLVFSKRLNVMDLQTEQVVSALDFDVQMAYKNHFDSSTMLACVSPYDNPKILLINDTGQVVRTMHPPGRVHSMQMVNEHHLLCTLEHSLCYFDMRYPSQAVPLIDVRWGAPLAVDVYNQRMALYSEKHASIITYDLHTMMWERVFMAPVTAYEQRYYGMSHLHDKFLIAGFSSNKKIYEITV